MEKNKLSLIACELSTYFGEDGINLLTIYNKLCDFQYYEYSDDCIVDLYDLYSHVSKSLNSYSIDSFVNDLVDISKKQNKLIEDICITDITEYRKAREKMEEKKTVFCLVDCEDQTHYKVLVFNENISHKELQLKIDNIKKDFYEKEIGGYMVDYVLENLALAYKFSINEPNPNLEI